MVFLSDPMLITSGVPPQGSVHGPDLFKIYVNYLPSLLLTVCLLYADDLKLWATVSCEVHIEQVQKALDLLFNWSLLWLLPLNYDKCCVLPIGSAQPQGIYQIGGYLLRETTLEKDLGLIVTPFSKLLMIPNESLPQLHGCYERFASRLLACRLVFSSVCL